MHQAYDIDADALYITLAEGTVARTAVIDDGCNVDLDADGKLLGIEVLNPGRAWPLLAILKGCEISDDDATMLITCYPHRFDVSTA
jgi:uncharacterized protein YuzE